MPTLSFHKQPAQSSRACYLNVASLISGRSGAWEGSCSGAAMRMLVTVNPAIDASGPQPASIQLRDEDRIHTHRFDAVDIHSEMIG